MHFALFLLLFGVTTSSVFACADGDTDCSCEQGMTSPEEFAARTNYLWMDHAELFTPVKMRKYDGGWSFTHQKQVPVYMTDFGVEKLRKSSPTIYERMKDLPYETITSFTYRYYYGPKVLGSMDFFKGSGRDYLIHFGEEELSKDERLRARKGAGPNEKFEGIDGYSPLNFRTNGFLLLTPSFVEDLTMNQYARVGILAVKPSDFILPPEELQFTLRRWQNGIDLNSVRVEAERTLLGGRDSHDLIQLTENQKVAVVAPLLLWNVSHGSFNAENISGTGQILDPGHTGFSAPMVSGQYRCTSCVGDMGDRSDNVMVAPLDYFFTSVAREKKALTSQLSDSVVSKITKQILKPIVGSFANQLPLSASDIALLRSLYREEVPLHSYKFVYKTFAHERHQKKFYDKIDREYFLSADADSENYMANGAVATRFIVQLAALKVIKGNEWFQAEISPFLSLLPSRAKPVFEPMIDIFVRGMGSNLSAKKAEEFLFSEYRPPNVVREEFTNQVRGVSDFGILTQKIKDAHERLSAPLVFTPEEWWKKIKLIWKTLEPADEEGSE